MGAKPHGLPGRGLFPGPDGGGPGHSGGGERALLRPAHQSHPIRYQRRQALFGHQQHQGGAQRPGGGRDHLLDRPGRPGGPDHRNLLGKYESLSDHITVEKRNPDVYPTFAEQYTSETVQNNSLVVECGDRSRYIAYDDIYLQEADLYSYTYNTSFDGDGGPSPRPSTMWSPRTCPSSICWRATARRSCPPPSATRSKRPTSTSSPSPC